MGSKQVIVMRKFTGAGSRTGKYIAQGAHASIGALFSLGSANLKDNTFVIDMSSPAVAAWLLGNFKKVTCYVNTDTELIEIYQAAKEAGIACALIQDAGLTEFDGVPTITSVGIGPADEAEINKITGHLPLF